MGSVDRSNVHVHPGVFIRTVVMPRLKIDVTKAAEDLGVTRVTLSRLLNGKCGISPTMALRLEIWLQDFGVTAQQWLEHQARYDLWECRLRNQEELKKVQRTTMNYNKPVKETTMSRIIHTAIVITATAGKELTAAVGHAEALGLNVLGPSPALVNGISTLVICPDGHKHGGQEAVANAKKREAFVNWLKRTDLDWVEVVYGTASAKAYVNSACIGESGE